jgi:sodium-dependent dicarboxylate transporter 2/3/5
MEPAAWRTVAVAFLMATWWVSEALPVAATALVPLVAFPLLGIAKISDTAAPYADPVIFLFLGGLTLGLAIQRWGLHLRIALAIIAVSGVRPTRLVLGFMLAAAFLSMWVSNTATAAMMLPVCLSTIAIMVGPPEKFRMAECAGRDLSLALLVGVAFAASIGGMATPIGTPPNALFIAFMRQTYDIDIGFGAWMMVGVPAALVFLIGAWLIVTRVAWHVPSGNIPGIGEHLIHSRAALEPPSRAEIMVALVFAATAVGWIARPALAEELPGLTDAGIALAAALTLFVLPSGQGGGLVDRETLSRLPWPVLILFGGGLSLAAAVTQTGLAGWLGDVLAGLGTVDTILLVAMAIVLTVALSELASNTATAAALLPIVASIADSLGLGAYALTLPVALAASCGLMLPVATPPNALFYASGYLRTADLARAGALCDLLGAIVVLAAAVALAPLVFGT